MRKILILPFLIRRAWNWLLDGVFVILKNRLWSTDFLLENNSKFFEENTWHKMQFLQLFVEFSRPWTIFYSRFLFIWWMMTICNFFHVIYSFLFWLQVCWKSWPFPYQVPFYHQNLQIFIMSRSQDCSRWKRRNKFSSIIWKVNQKSSSASRFWNN